MIFGPKSWTRVPVLTSQRIEGEKISDITQEETTQLRSNSVARLQKIDVESKNLLELQHLNSVGKIVSVSIRTLPNGFKYAFVEYESEAGVDSLMSKGQFLMYDKSTSTQKLSMLTTQESNLYKTNLPIGTLSTSTPHNCKTDVDNTPRHRCFINWTATETPLRGSVSCWMTTATLLWLRRPLPVN